MGAFYADPTLKASVDTPYGVLDSGDIKDGHKTMPRRSADLLLLDSQGLSFDYYRYSRTDRDSIGGSYAVLTTLPWASNGFR